MTAIMILTWIVSQTSYDGGASVHVARIEFSTMARCEAAAASMRAEASRMESWRSTKARVSAVCVMQ